MDVEAITTEAAWDALEGEWNPLVEHSASATVFLTWEWLRPWWRHYHKACDSPYVLVARDAGTLVGLAPLYRSLASAHGLGSLRRLGFMGDSSGDSEYLDFIAEPGREREILGAFFDHIEADRESWDVAELRLLPKSSPHLDLLGRLAAERGYLTASDDAPCSSVALPDDWDAYLKTLQSRFRGKVRSLLRRLPAEHGATFERCETMDDLPERLESMYALHQQRWRADGKPGAFASEARRAFYSELSERLMARGWLRFYSLRLDRRWVAHEYSFEHLGRVYYLQQGFDASCGRLSVGVALKAHVLRDSIAGGAREYDFLGGVAGHKQKWGAATKHCVHLTLARPGLKTRWHLWLPRFAARVRDRGRTLAPACLLQIKRDLQDHLRRGRARRFADHDAPQETPQ